MARAAGVLGEAARAGQLAGKSAVEPDWTIAGKPGGRGLGALGRRTSRGSAGTQRRHAAAGQRAILGPAEVEVGGRRFAARKGLVIATGTEQAIPSIDGLSGVPYWTNREAVEAGAIPRSLIVLGAGAVGLELAQAFRRFGAEVTVVEAAGHALPMEEPENAAAIDEVLRRDGITLITGTTATAAASSERGVTVELSDGTHLEAERLLVATGRRPDLRSLGVAELGIDPDAPSVATDENLRAGDGVWAVGDVTGHGEFTHVAYYQAQIAAADILGTEHEPADYTAVPRVTFTDPEVASVGLTEASARARGLDVKVGLLPTRSSDRGWLHGPGADLGVTKVVADADAGVLVGGSVMGPASGRGGSIPGTGHPRPDPGAPPDGGHLPLPDIHARRSRRAPQAGLTAAARDGVLSPPAASRQPRARRRRCHLICAADLAESSRT